MERICVSKNELAKLEVINRKDYAGSNFKSVDMNQH